MIIVKYTFINFFETLGELFSDLDRNSSHVCRKNNLSVPRKNVRKKTLQQLFFFVNLDSDKILPEKFWQGCQNYFLRVQRNT